MSTVAVAVRLMEITLMCLPPPVALETSVVLPDEAEPKERNVGVSARLLPAVPLDRRVVSNATPMTD